MQRFTEMTGHFVSRWQITAFCVIHFHTVYFFFFDTCVSVHFLKENRVNIFRFYLFIFCLYVFLNSLLRGGEQLFLNGQ